MNKENIYILIFLLVINIKSWTVYCQDDYFTQNDTIEIENNEVNRENSFDSTTYILLDILKLLPKYNISDNCYKDIKRVEAAINSREIWAIKGVLIK